MEKVFQALLAHYEPSNPGHSSLAHLAELREEYQSEDVPDGRKKDIENYLAKLIS